MTNWLDALTELVKAAAAGKAGQVGRVQVEPPERRYGVFMSVTGDPRGIVVGCGDTEKSYSADQSEEAIRAYIAAVEANA